MILLVDNYDSFSYNLYQLVGALQPDIRVVRNDAVSLADIESMRPSHIILSPGPGRPADAGLCESIVRRFAGKIPILGVCLGHQAICEALGGVVSYAKQLVHGKSSHITLDTACPLFEGLPLVIQGARYHSLAALEERLPDQLCVCARTQDGEIMGVWDKNNYVFGLQFHPESVLTPEGPAILRNFLSIKEIPKKGGGCVIKQAIVKAAMRQDLSYDMARDVMDEIMSGQASEIQMAAYLTAMSVKGESIGEITGSAAGMRDHCIRLLHNMDVLEIVGTGGDHSNSFNISTTSSLVISAAGVSVAKHGNRAATSKSGAADVLEALGVNITLKPEESLHLLKTINLCFLFAQNYHIAMKYVAPVRKELGIRTIFNILGPLVNPAGANMELLGVYDESLVRPMAEVLSNLGVKSAMVVFGQDSLDEISMSAPTTVCEVRYGQFLSYELTPEQFGMERCDKQDLTGGTPAENAAITRAILEGEKGPRRNAVVLNSAAAIYIARPGITMEDAVAIAEETIDSKKALSQLERFISLSNAGAVV